MKPLDICMFHGIMTNRLTSTWIILWIILCPLPLPLTCVTDENTKSENVNVAGIAVGVSLTATVLFIAFICFIVIWYNAHYKKKRHQRIVRTMTTVPSTATVTTTQATTQAAYPVEGFDYEPQEAPPPYALACLYPQPPPPFDPPQQPYPPPAYSVHQMCPLVV